MNTKDKSEVPPFVIRERDSRLADINEVFADLNRDGDVSWREAEVLDAYETPEECDAARAADKDTRWQELVTTQIGVNHRE